MKNKKTLIAVLFALMLVVGCASLTPGADPLVVRVEQTETAAGATFDMVLHVDAADRGFWKTNAPAFHQFCEWLRTPMNYKTNVVARCVELQFNVDDLKLSYQASKTTGTSNSLYSAWMVLNTAFSQASSWQTIVTTPDLTPRFRP